MAHLEVELRCPNSDHWPNWLSYLTGRQNDSKDKYIQCRIVPEQLGHGLPFWIKVVVPSPLPHNGSLTGTLHVVFLIFLLGRVSGLWTGSLRGIFAPSFLRSADRRAILSKCPVPTCPVVTFSQRFHSVFWSLPWAVTGVSVPAPPRFRCFPLTEYMVAGSCVLWLLWLRT